jgi:hypothetical protein
VVNVHAGVDQDRCTGVFDCSCGLCTFAHVWMHVWNRLVVCQCATVRALYFLCVTMALAPGQDGKSCLYMACQQGHLVVVKYLCRQGGKQLLMLTEKVSALRIVGIVGVCQTIYTTDPCV